MNGPSALAHHVIQQLSLRARPFGIEIDRQWRVTDLYGDRDYYGLDSLDVGCNLVDLFPLLQGLEGPHTTEFPFVEMVNGRCANVIVMLEADGGRVILSDDTPEKLRYQEIRQTSNETVLNAYRHAQAEEALFQEKELAEVTLKSIGDAVIRTNKLARVTYLNPVAEAMTGWRNEEAYDKPINEIFCVLDGHTQQPTLDPVQLVLTENRTLGLAANSILLSRNGSQAAIEDSAAPIRDRQGNVIGAVLVFHDVSESRAMAVRMTHLAQHDHLTGLPNRVMLHDRIVQTMMRAQRHGQRAALLFLDLDQFKHVNDSLGHMVGDQLLQEIARRLKTTVRAFDTVSRQGGDEFIVLLNEINGPGDVAHIAEKLLQSVAEPCDVDGNELSVTLSIGISMFPDDGNDVDTLMKSADAAMYHAKENGRNNYQFFTPNMHEKAMSRQKLENGLRRALRRSEFVLHYQPKLCLRTGDIVGIEALLRWQHPTEGLIAPASFIRVAEEGGLISAIGEWVLREACQSNQRWQQSGLLNVPIAVNISAVQFRDRNFLAQVAGILRDTGLDAHWLELELTESIVMQDSGRAEALLEELREMGVRLSIDDFGTGYSSLAYLRRFKIDALKIDQSFVQDVSSNADDRAIVSAIISMAKSLKQRVIAEGVETSDQMRFLTEQACDEVQGNCLCRPLAAAEFEAYVAS